MMVQLSEPLIWYYGDDRKMLATLRKDHSLINNKVQSGVATDEEKHILIHIDKLLRQNDQSHPNYGGDL